MINLRFDVRRDIGVVSELVEGPADELLEELTTFERDLDGAEAMPIGAFTSTAKPFV